jgi:hypothetical protein
LWVRPSSLPKEISVKQSMRGMALVLLACGALLSPASAQEFLNPFIREVPRPGYPGNISAGVLKLQLNGEPDPAMADQLLANTVRLFPHLEFLYMALRQNSWVANGINLTTGRQLRLDRGGSAPRASALASALGGGAKG